MKSQYRCSGGSRPSSDSILNSLNELLENTEKTTDYFELSLALILLHFLTVPNLDLSLGKAPECCAVSDVQKKSTNICVSCG